VVERKDLPDLVRSFTTERTVFINRLRLMAQCPHRWLVITDTVSQVKSPYPRTSVSPNWITQSLIAVLAGLQVPFLCTETHELGEELVASYLYHVHLYHWLEANYQMSQHRRHREVPQHHRMNQGMIPFGQPRKEP